MNTVTISPTGYQPNEADQGAKELWENIELYNVTPLQLERIRMSMIFLSMASDRQITEEFLEYALSSQKTANYHIAILDYIINSHHKYALDSIPMIEETIGILANQMKDLSGDLEILKNHFHTIKGILEKHFTLEESLLFRFIRILVYSYKNKLSMPGAPFVSVSNYVRKMEADDLKVNIELNAISELCTGLDKIEIPEVQMLSAKLNEFRDDLLVHIYLEDKILYPFTMVIEKRLNGNGKKS